MGLEDREYNIHMPTTCSTLFPSTQIAVSLDSNVLPLPLLSEPSRTGMRWRYEFEAKAGPLIKAAAMQGQLRVIGQGGGIPEFH